MKRNIEIKAKVIDLCALVVKLAAMADGQPVAIYQDDTYFKCRTGRLKLRSFADGKGELIYYRRPNDFGPKKSCYQLTATDTPEALRDILSMAFGEVGRVKKQRTVYMVGRTRIHLDRVDRLGDFLELEVVLANGEDAEAGIIEAHSLMDRLEISQAQLVQGAYLDLLGEKISS